MTTNPSLLMGTILLLLIIIMIVHGQEETQGVNSTAPVDSTNSPTTESTTTTIPVNEVEVDNESPAEEDPAHVKGVGTEIHHPDEEQQKGFVGPDQDHVGIHGEYENGMLYDDDFDPWNDFEDELNEHDPFFELEEPVGGKEKVPETQVDLDSEDHHLNKYDFSPSEGLQFVLKGHEKECFFEDVQTFDDHLRGGFMTVAGEPKLDMYILDPSGEKVFRETSETESEYDLEVKELGVFEICFDNSGYSTEKLIVFATETIESHYPVRKEHLSHLTQYASHLDVKLGKLASEQQLYFLRADRHLATEKSTNARLSWYTSLECFAYCAISVVQVVYIKHILEQPLISRSWA